MHSRLLANTTAQWIENGLLYGFVFLAGLPVYALLMRRVGRLQKRRR